MVAVVATVSESRSAIGIVSNRYASELEPVASGHFIGSSNQGTSWWLAADILRVLSRYVA